MSDPRTSVTKDHSSQCEFPRFSARKTQTLDRLTKISLDRDVQPTQDEGYSGEDQTSVHQDRTGRSEQVKDAVYTVTMFSEVEGVEIAGPGEGRLIIRDG
jgi:hypothetical protein